ncbi:MAG: hypothetical protein A3E19_03725 [Planctomycetes bacterium RIFCSPHIGHO2_12_FULL_52_36]|nr:MAG: hypothetical protein A3D89_05875 [Planctomycetes bacterium RIFCSPHIGHO2_02_FULL_52_58]OHB93115.1 MAG: hypothetical protein A3E19_03725 [Planctomycetes bacterium RIFCSPHIGHO2_12_FULL_52_36]
MEKKLPPHPAIFIALYAVGIPLCCLQLVSPPAALASLMSLPLLVVASIYYVIFLARLWELAQVSPLRIKKPISGEAVGLQNVPLFNFYWLFISHRNLALHLNHLAGQEKIPVTLVTVGCALAVSIVLSPVGFIILAITYFYFYESARCIGRKEK